MDGQQGNGREGDGDRDWRDWAVVGCERRGLTGIEWGLSGDLEGEWRDFLGIWKKSIGIGKYTVYSGRIY